MGALKIFKNKIFFTVLLGGLLALRMVEASTPVREYGGALYRLGIRSEGKKKISQAARYFQRAIYFDPARVDAYAHLSLIYSQRKNLEKAIRYARTAVLLDPQSHQGFHALGVAYREKGDYLLALENLQRAYQIYPHRPYVGTYTYDIGKTYLSMNDLTTGLAKVDELRRMGEPELARELESAIAHHP